VDFLKSLFGMLTSSVLRLAVSVGILVAAYFLIVRPALDTTNKAIDSANHQLSGFNSINGNVSPKIQRAINQTMRRVRREIDGSRHQRHLSRHQKKLLHCMQHLHGDLNRRYQRCARRF
jgi:hypothetical protein